MHLTNKCKKRKEMQTDKHINLSTLKVELPKNDIYKPYYSVRLNRWLAGNDFVNTSIYNPVGLTKLELPKQAVQYKDIYNKITKCDLRSSALIYVGKCHGLWQMYIVKHVILANLTAEIKLKHKVLIQKFNKWCNRQNIPTRIHIDKHTEGHINLYKYMRQAIGYLVNQYITLICLLDIPKEFQVIVYSNLT